MGKRNFVHLDIPFTGDDASIVNFYENFCEWEIFRDPQYPYVMYSSGNLTGGFSQEDETYKVDSMILYIESDDLDADMKQIEALGGSIVSEKIDVPEYGAYVIVKDPAGNRFGLWQNLAENP